MTLFCAHGPDARPLDLVERITGLVPWTTLRRELGDNLIAVEFPGRKHATLTEHRPQAAVDRVLAFFDEKLKTPTESAT